MFCCPVHVSNLGLFISCCGHEPTLEVLCNANFHSVPYRNFSVAIFLLLTIPPYPGLISNRLYWFGPRFHSTLLMFHWFVSPASSSSFFRGNPPFSSASYWPTALTYRFICKSRLAPAWYPAPDLMLISKISSGNILDAEAHCVQHVIKDGRATQAEHSKSLSILH